VEVDVFKNWLGFDFICELFFLARSAPSLPPCDRLQLRWAIPAPSSPGVKSPVSASGGSWSAVGPIGWAPDSDMSTSYPHLIQIGSHLARTSLRQFL